MAAMQRRFLAVASALAAFAVPAFAQRGGPRGANAGHIAAGPSFRGGFAPLSRTPFMGAPQFSSRPGSQLSLRFSAPYAGRPGRPVYYPDYRYRRPYIPNYYYGYGLGLPYYYSGIVGYIPDALDYSDYADSANSGYPDNYAAQPPAAPYLAPDYQYQQPAPPYAYPQGAEPPYTYPQQAPQQPYPQPPSQAYAPQPSYRAPYQSPQSAPASGPQVDDSAVTLVFKDGRPNEQIHNYMLTRTTLYVSDHRLREIPVDQLDLAATKKANQDAGIDFELPAAR